MSIFYSPEEGYAGDFIPFYWDGTYHLFYIKDYRDEEKHGRGMPWFHVATRDFTAFKDYGEAIPHGSAEEQDLYVFTGSVLENEGLFHIFYTGHNPVEDWEPRQALMHATSEDLVHWKKDDGFLVGADEGRYEADDWRDPFVFWNGAAGEFWMLLAARKKTGPVSRRGCIALLSSSDLEKWNIHEPFWAPGLYHTHECPDLFRWGNWWYLVYSTFSERFVTHYRLSESLDGPWLAPQNDSFDGRAYYAAKTAGDGTRRFSFGWNPTKKGRVDEGDWQWGGSLVVHEIKQNANGNLGVHLPTEIRSAFNTRVDSDPVPRIGKWQVVEDRIESPPTDGFSWCEMGTMPQTCLIETRVTPGEGTRGCGLFIRSKNELEVYYQARLEPERNPLVFDSWPRPGDRPFTLERPLEMEPGLGVDIEVIADGSVIEVYAGNQVAMSTRGYDHRVGSFGLFVSEGSATFDNNRISIIPGA